MSKGYRPADLNLKIDSANSPITAKNGADPAQPPVLGPRLEVRPRDGDVHALVQVRVEWLAERLDLGHALGLEQVAQLALDDPVSLTIAAASAIVVLVGSVWTPKDMSSRTVMEGLTDSLRSLTNLALVWRRSVSRITAAAALSCPPPPNACAIAATSSASAGSAARYVDWPQRWRQVLTRLPCGVRSVAVAYADWRRADAPPPAEIVAFALAHRSALLFDTWCKDGTTLLDWIGTRHLQRIANSLHRRHLSLALAGALGPRQIGHLLKVRPDWFAVRGSVCSKGNRQAGIQRRRVRQLVQFLATHRNAEVSP